MKKNYLLLILVFSLCLCSCGESSREESENTTSQDDLVALGRYYQDGDSLAPFIEILSDEKIDVSNADVKLLVDALEDVRLVDYPDDTEDERKEYLENAEKVLSTPYVYEVAEKGNVVEISISEFDGEFLAIIMEYNPVDNIIVWGNREFVLVK